MDVDFGGDDFGFDEDEVARAIALSMGAMAEVSPCLMFDVVSRPSSSC